MVTEEEMDKAALEAEKELRQKLETSSATALYVAEWWSKWYMQAGHKRLGRLMVKIAKEQKKEI
jgi:hypothetical protein